MEKAEKDTSRSTVIECSPGTPPVPFLPQTQPRQNRAGAAAGAARGDAQAQSG